MAFVAEMKLKKKMNTKYEQVLIFTCCQNKKKLEKEILNVSFMYQLMAKLCIVPYFKKINKI